MGCGKCERMIHVMHGSDPNIHIERQAASHVEEIAVSGSRKALSLHYHEPMRRQSLIASAEDSEMCTLLLHTCEKISSKHQAMTPKQILEAQQAIN